MGFLSRLFGSTDMLVEENDDLLELNQELQKSKQTLEKRVAELEAQLDFTKQDRDNLADLASKAQDELLAIHDRLTKERLKQHDFLKTIGLFS